MGLAVEWHGLTLKLPNRIKQVLNSTSRMISGSVTVIRDG